MNKDKPKNGQTRSEACIYLLRHGEIATPGILAGKTDVALSSAGVNQLWQAVEHLSNIEQCISSPLIRCQAWAQQYCLKTGVALNVEPNIREMDFGDWDGKTYQTLWQKNTPEGQTTLGDFWQSPWQHTPPNGEQMTAFTQRVEHWWQAFLKQPHLANTLVVAHGGVIKQIIASILQLPAQSTVQLSAIDVPYAGLIKINLFRDEQNLTWPKIIL